MPEFITSLQNSRIKNIVKLQEKSSERKKQNLIVIEGLREINLAVNSGFKIDSLFHYKEINSSEHSILSKQIFEISKEVFDKIAYRENSDGLIALAIPEFLTLDEIQLSPNPFLIILEAVEKPGNLGAILRTADAAKADALIVCDPKTDIYNPNTIRSSVGCVFTQQVVTATTDEVLSWVKKNKIISYAAALTAKKFYHETDLASPCAIVMGTEATGLTDKWLNGADEQIKIPMRGKIDSLNVSTSTAIITFEAMRQRQFEDLKI
jgi:RNA methyltransferase, TrmH family